jgi:hypothetical protein
MTSDKMAGMSTAAPTDPSTSNRSVLLQCPSEGNAQLELQLVWCRQQLSFNILVERVIDKTVHPLLAGLMGKHLQPLASVDKKKTTYERGKSRTELGAEHVLIIQSLIVECKTQSIEPAAYLKDELQRVSIHSAGKIQKLTRRAWKALFAQNPL